MGTEKGRKKDRKRHETQMKEVSAEWRYSESSVVVRSEVRGHEFQLRMKFSRRTQTCLRGVYQPALQCESRAFERQQYNEFEG